MKSRPSLRRSDSRNYLTMLALALALLFQPGALAHPEILFAEITTVPEEPQPGEEFELTALITNTGRIEITGLDVELRIFEPGTEIARDLLELEGAVEAPDKQPIAVYELDAPEGSAAYSGTISGLPEGSYPIRVVELVRGGKPESNTAGELPVGLGPVYYELVMPPVPPSVGTWLLWLIAIPLVAGVLVTVMVVRSKPAGGEEGEAASQ